MAHGTSQCSGDFSASQVLGHLGLLCQVSPLADLSDLP